MALGDIIILGILLCWLVLSLRYMRHRPQKRQMHRLRRRLQRLPLRHLPDRTARQKINKKYLACGHIYNTGNTSALLPFPR